MQQVDVDSVPIEEQILPTSRPFASVYGFDDDILSVPRNVTIVSRAQLDAIDIQDVTQFSKLTASSYTDSDFGSPANPTIRGQPADYFVNGMRQHVGDNGDGMPVDFNSMESVNIVPGPATAVQGASAYVGGYVDVITKQPFFDATRGYVSATTGSFDTDRWTLDVGGPIDSTLAYRISYSGEDSDGFWEDFIHQTTSFYGAIAYRPSDTYELLMTVNFFDADYRENFGIDRPTEALIKDGLYQSGTNINGGTKATPTDLQNTANVGGDPSGSDIIAWGPVIPVDYRESAQGPATHSHGREFNWQAIQTFKVSPEFQIVNNTAIAYTKRDTYNSDGYNEVDDPTEFIDNRTELLFLLPKTEINAGLEERYLQDSDYADFFFEPVNVWDVSTIPLKNDINFSNSNYFAGTFGNAPIPGWPGRYATQGIINDDTNHTEVGSVSPYVQSTWKLSDQFSILVGARMDLMHVQVRDPLTPNTFADIGVGEPNANLSLVYKLTPTLSTYGTVNYSQNYTGDLADGGGFALYSDANGNPTLPRSYFSEVSDLFEYGVKVSADSGKLFSTTDVFLQNRQTKPQIGAAQQYRYYGFETSENYQPNRNFFATFGFSWINGSLPAPSSPDDVEGYDTDQIPGGPPDPNTDPQAYQTTGRLRAPGQPLDLVNALAQYTFTSGFGFELNAVVTSSMNNDYYGYLVIPWQYQVDGGVYYKVKKWEIRLTGTNLTNQHNWVPNAGYYALEGITSVPTIQGYVTVRYKF